MQADVWAAAAAALLAVAAGCSVATWTGKGRRWLILSVTARGGSIVALALAAYLAAAGQGTWSPLDLRQVTLGLALATALAHLALSWAVGAPAGSPIADVVTAALALAALLAAHPAGAGLTCLQQALPYRAEWVLFLAGAAGILVGGSAALALALPWPWLSSGASRLLAAGTSLGVLAVGAGIVTGLWWTWQATGTLEAGDIRESWMAVVWLLAAMSTAAWQLEKGARRWAAGLGLAAAAAVLLGLLTLPNLQRLMGM
jgi:hypothetical protein